MTTGSNPTPDRIRILSFTGTRTSFVAYLLRLIADQHEALVDSDPADYEWELTASIARHPAGKGLGWTEEISCRQCGSTHSRWRDCPPAQRTSCPRCIGWCSCEPAPDLSTCPHGYIAASCTECQLDTAPPYGFESACGRGHQTAIPCSGEIWCPDEDACAICGTVEPNGGLMKMWKDGQVIGLRCNYTLGCTPGVQRPRTG